MNRSTLTRVLVAAGLVVACALLVGRATVGAEHAVAANRQELDTAAVDLAAAAVSTDLERAHATLDGIRRALRDGAIPLDDTSRLELELHATIVDDPMLVAVSFTRANRVAFEPSGRTTAAQDPRWRLELVRPSDDDTHIAVHRVARGGAGWVDDLQKVTLGRPALADPFRRLGDAPDPTEDVAFVAATDKGAGDREVWLDLHYADADAASPEALRRAVVTIARTVLDADGTFLGVARVDRVVRAQDDAAHVESNHADERDVFVCDAEGRLLTRGNDGDVRETIDGRLRVATPPSPAIAGALRSPTLRSLAPDGGLASDEVTVGRSRYAATFRALDGTEPWIVGAVTPEGHTARRAGGPRANGEK